MAIAYFDVKILGRVDKATGRQNSVVAAAAYRSGTKLYDERRECWQDYTKKHGIAYTEILAPENTPPNLLIREKLWNTADGCENRKDSQLCRQYEFALPRELTLDQNIALAREYGQYLVSKGMIVDMSIHDNRDGNPHVHYLATMRELEKDGFGKKCREWNSKEMLMEWRQGFEDITNRHLRENGHEVQISVKSYKDQGVDRKPTVHMGNAATHMERKGIKTAKGDYNRQVAEENRQIDEVNRQIAEANKEAERLKKEIAQEQAREQEQALSEHDIKQEQKPEPGIPTLLALGIHPVASDVHDLYAAEAKKIEEEKKQAEEQARKQAQIEHDINDSRNRRIIQAIQEDAQKEVAATQECAEVAYNATGYYGGEITQEVQEAQTGHNIEQKPELGIPIPSSDVHDLYAAEAKRIDEEKRQAEQLKEQIEKEKEQLRRDIEELRQNSVERNVRRKVPTHQTLETQSEEDFDIEKYLEDETAQTVQGTAHRDALDLGAQIEKEEHLKQDIEAVREYSTGQEPERESPTSQVLETQPDPTVRETVTEQSSEKTQEQEPGVPTPQITESYPTVNDLYAEEAKKNEEEKKKTKQEVVRGIAIYQTIEAIANMDIGKIAARGEHAFHGGIRTGIRTGITYEGQGAEEQSAPHHDRMTGRDEADDLYKREARTLHMEDKTGNGRDPPTKQR